VQCVCTIVLYTCFVRLVFIVLCPLNSRFVKTFCCETNDVSLTKLLKPSQRVFLVMRVIPPVLPPTVLLPSPHVKHCPYSPVTSQHWQKYLPAPLPTSTLHCIYYKQCIQLDLAQMYLHWGNIYFPQGADPHPPPPHWDR
jgi:hypothetical protein